MDLASFYISGGAVYELESIFECQENWRFRNLQCFMGHNWIAQSYSGYKVQGDICQFM